MAGSGYRIARIAYWGVGSRACISLGRRISADTAGCAGCRRVERKRHNVNNTQSCVVAASGGCVSGGGVVVGGSVSGGGGGVVVVDWWWWHATGR